MLVTGHSSDQGSWEGQCIRVEDSQRELESRYILSDQPEMGPGTTATLSHCMHSPLTTEEVVDDGVGGTVGIH